MPFFHKNKLLPYHKADLYNLVLDIESYPEFIPWCKAARIISRKNDEIIAELVIEFKGFTEKYQSKITTNIQDKTHIISVEAISGPFEHLSNIWKFTEENEQTKVDFFIDFKLKSFFLEQIIGIFFMKAAEKMIDAFEKRAEFFSKINYK